VELSEEGGVVVVVGVGVVVVVVFVAAVVVVAAVAVVVAAAAVATVAAVVWGREGGGGRAGWGFPFVFSETSSSPDSRADPGSCLLEWGRRSRFREPVTQIRPATLLWWYLDLRHHPRYYSVWRWHPIGSVSPPPMRV